MNHKPQTWLPPALALVPPFAALLLQSLFWSWLQPLVWVFFYPAVFFSAWIGGLRGGLWATGMSAILVWFYFIEPRATFSIHDHRLLWSVLVFVGMGVLFSVINQRLQDALHSLKDLNKQLEEKVHARTTELEGSQASAELTKARITSIIGSAMDAIISVDNSQTIVLFNTAAEHTFRCPASSALGQPLGKFIPERFREAHIHHIEDFGKAGITSRITHDLGTLWGVRADGEVFPFEASISQFDVAGQKNYTVILRDITERKRDETTKELLAAIVESSSDAIVGKDLNSIVTSWNPGAELIFGYSASEMIGQSITRIIPPTVISTKNASSARSAGGKRWSILRPRE